MDYIYQDDYVDVTTSLVGPSGPVAVLSSRATVVKTPPQRLIDAVIAADMPAGVYIYSVRLQVSGGWFCSIHLRDVCSWHDPRNMTDRFKFVWDGNARVVSSYREARTAASLRARVTKKTRVKLTGVVKEQRRGSDFQPVAAMKRAAGVRVQIMRYKSIYGEWVRVKTVKTDRHGRFSVALKSSKRSKWRAVVVPDSERAASKSRTVTK